MRKKNFKKIKDTTGIYVNKNTGTYYAEKRIKGILFSKSFDTLENAKRWHVHLQGANIEDANLINESSCSTLKAVWKSMQTHHFLLLATSTKEVWIRRYKLLERLENLPIDQITPSKITEWVQYWVKQFGRDDYQENGRGKIRRCNLNNELNMFVTIFNWYKQSEQFEKEALLLTNPVKTKHKKMGFIRPIPDRKKQIDLNSAFLFFLISKATLSRAGHDAILYSRKNWRGCRNSMVRCRFRK